MPRRTPPTTNVPSDDSTNHTLDPEESLGRPTQMWGAADETSVPAIGVPEPVEEPLAESAYALADKLLRGGIPVGRIHLAVLTLGGWAVLVVWLYIQDNGAGKLNNIDDLIWFGTKAVAISIVPTTILVLIVLWSIGSFISSKLQR